MTSLIKKIGPTATLPFAVDNVGNARLWRLINAQYWRHASCEESNQWTARLPSTRHRILQFSAESIGPDPQDDPVQKFAMRILGTPKRSPDGVVGGPDFNHVVDFPEHVQRAGRPRGLTRKQPYLSRELRRQITYTTPAPPLRGNRIASVDGTKPAKSPKTALF